MEWTVIANEAETQRSNRCTVWIQQHIFNIRNMGEFKLSVLISGWALVQGIHHWALWLEGLSSIFELTFVVIFPIYILQTATNPWSTMPACLVHEGCVVELHLAHCTCWYDVAVTVHRLFLGLSYWELRACLVENRPDSVSLYDMPMQPLLTCTSCYSLNTDAEMKSKKFLHSHVLLS